jgi:hypothetical protein
VHDRHHPGCPHPPTPRCTRLGVAAALAAIPVSWLIVALAVWAAWGLIR